VYGGGGRRSPITTLALRSELSGELSQRTGVSVHTLRAWENRYQLLRPRRSGEGTRLYAALDEARVRLMRRYLEQGLATAQAAEMVASARLTISPAAGPLWRGLREHGSIITWRLR
jgi:DNA-binding transcriptional MerR regulator